MANQINKLFTDEKIIAKIQLKLPRLFRQAELETTRGGKIGMEVGTLREKIIIGLLIYVFGKENIETEIGVNEPESDVKISGDSFSIKTLSGSLNGLKLIWTVDAEMAIKFSKKYLPSCDIIFVHINWDKQGGFFCIPKSAQLSILEEIGRGNYIKLPKAGRNPRGVEMTGIALKNLIDHKDTYKIFVNWQKENITFNSITRWVELWEQD
jgi:hypothetical protein